MSILYMINLARHNYLSKLAFLDYLSTNEGQYFELKEGLTFNKN